MGISLKKIHHLIRYFIVIGIIVFIGYIKRWNDDAFMLLIGPMLYLAYTVKNMLASLIPLPDTETLNYFLFLMPVTLLYFGLLGFQLKQLWNERGKIRFLSLFALIVFVLYIHYAAWRNLSGYFLIPDNPTLPSFHLGSNADRTLGSDQTKPVGV